MVWLVRFGLMLNTTGGLAVYIDLARAVYGLRQHQFQTRREAEIN
jgi:hypothetical protein